jgi:tRNA A37 N6-isopentenylltransferase MiaA
LPAMSGIGYRQIGEYLTGRATLDQAAQRIKWDTHAFSRHQGNWFRRPSSAAHIDVTGSDPFPEAQRLLAQFLEGA